MAVRPLLDAMASSGLRDQIAAGTIAGFIVVVLEYFVIAPISSGRPPPDVGAFAPWLLPPVVAGGFVGFVVQRRQRARADSGLGILAIPSRPQIAVASVELDHFGVRWKATVGYMPFHPEDVYAYVEGPFCPDHDYGLDGRTHVTLLGSKRFVWRCGVCQREFQRPRQDLFKEDDVVGKVAVAEWRRRQKGDRGQPA